MKTVIEIFLSFLQVGAFSFGGGLAMLPLIEKEIVHAHHWITSGEFVDIVAIAQMTPGPIAINSATFVGYKVAGLSGAIAGSVGVILVSFLLVSVFAKYFIQIKDRRETKAVFAGIRPTVLGLILSAAISVGKTAFVDFKSVIIALLVFIGIHKLNLHPILGIVAAGILGILMY
ncbi:MAG: chromate transporter [Bacillota bacterium]